MGWPQHLTTTAHALSVLIGKREEKGERVVRVVSYYVSLTGLTGGGAKTHGAGLRSARNLDPRMEGRTPARERERDGERERERKGGRERNKWFGLNTSYYRYHHDLSSFLLNYTTRNVQLHLDRRCL